MMIELGKNCFHCGVRVMDMRWPFSEGDDDDYQLLSPYELRFCSLKCRSAWRADQQDRADSWCGRGRAHEAHSWSRPGEGRGARWCRG